MSTDLLDEIQAQLPPDTAARLSQRTGSSPEQASAAISAALPMLLGALANNSARPGGAESISQAIERDGHGTEDLAAMLERELQVGPAPANQRMVNHMLGQRRAPVEQALAAKTGMPTSGVAQILEVLGPLVMGAVGKQQRGKGLNPADLTDFLGQQKSSAKSKSGDLGSMLFDLLDANDDGSIMDDVMRLAGQFMGPGAKK
jgi:hypothetical protein